MLLICQWKRDEADDNLNNNTDPQPKQEPHCRRSTTDRGRLFDDNSSTTESVTTQFSCSLPSPGRMPPIEWIDVKTTEDDEMSYFSRITIPVDP